VDLVKSPLELVVVVKVVLGYLLLVPFEAICGLRRCFRLGQVFPADPFLLRICTHVGIEQRV